MTKIRADHVRLFLLPEVEQRIRHYTDLAGGEVSGLGTVEEFDGGFLVNNVYLPKQTCSPAGTTLDEDAIATLLMELEAAGEDSGRLRFWWHSHAHHDVFWSGTDEQCIEGLANGDYVLSLVTNKRGGTLARLDIFKPARVTVDGIPVSVHAVNDDLRNACAAELTANLSEIAGFGRHVVKMPAAERGLFDGHWSDSPLDAVDEMSALRHLFQAGELSYAEYVEHLEELEACHEW